MTGQTVVIVGASHAAVQAVDTLRREGHTGRIVLVGDEPYLPYNRPPLSKKYLAGEMDRERLLLRSSQFYELGHVEVQARPARHRHRPRRPAAAAQRRRRTALRPADPVPRQPQPPARSPGLRPPRHPLPAHHCRRRRHPRRPRRGAAAGDRRRRLHRPRGRGVGPAPGSRRDRARDGGPAAEPRHGAGNVHVLHATPRTRGRARAVRHVGHLVHRQRGRPGGRRRLRRARVPRRPGDRRGRHPAGNHAGCGGRAALRERHLGRRAVPDLRPEHLRRRRLHLPPERALRATRCGSSPSTTRSSRRGPRPRTSAASPRGTSTCRGSGRTSTTSSCRSPGCRRATTRPCCVATRSPAASRSIISRRASCWRSTRSTAPRTS